MRQDWYHNMSSVLDAGSCVRTNQIDFDESNQDPMLKMMEPNFIKIVPEICSGTDMTDKRSRKTLSASIYLI